ncbi:MAG TPA: cobyrinate a,c-diamide synthase, partial [Baekduia sp.]|nr:cobyrinate a,c-diamide synthase [Baekduia sp.]
MTGRLVIAGTHSGAGKTTVASGLMAALSRAGHRVAPFKVGPDFIDPGYHRLACGRPGRNLDAFLSGPELIAPLVAHGSAGADLAVVEGVMGLFDGASGGGELASSAQVAKLLGAPVVLVVDASAMARSVAAIVHGFATFDPDLRLGGVVLNRVASDWHEELLRAAIAPTAIPVLGVLRRDASLAVPERHLGLVPAVEREAHARTTLDALADTVGASLDMESLVALARSAPALGGEAWRPEPPDDAVGAGGD